MDMGTAGADSEAKIKAEGTKDKDAQLRLAKIKRMDKRSLPPAGTEWGDVLTKGHKATGNSWIVGNTAALDKLNGQSNIAELVCDMDGKRYVKIRMHRGNLDASSASRPLAEWRPMSSTGSGYDLSATTFSPDGRLFQVEYAVKAVEASGTAIGLKCKDGVILAVENLLISKMLVPGSNRKVFTVGPHLGIAITGLTADGRQIVNRAREEAESYKDNYGSDIAPGVLADRLAQFMHYFTCYGSLRPFGASAIVAGYDPYTGNHEMYMIEPSGTNYKYFGTAAGKGRQGAKTEIEKLKLTELPVEDAIKEVTKILYKLHDDTKDKPFELELTVLAESTKWLHKAVPRETIAAAEAWAKAAIEAEDMDEDEDES